MAVEFIVDQVGDNIVIAFFHFCTFGFVRVALLSVWRFREFLDGHTIFRSEPN